jgi:hypothetical protein
MIHFELTNIELGGVQVIDFDFTGLAFVRIRAGRGLCLGHPAGRGQAGDENSCR